MRRVVRVPGGVRSGAAGLDRQCTAYLGLRPSIRIPRRRLVSPLPACQPDGRVVVRVALDLIGETTMQAVSEVIRPTRYPELGYRQDGPGLWRIYAVAHGSQPAAVGPHYRSKAELLGDLVRYATEYGL